MSNRNLKSLQKAINIVNYLAENKEKGVTEISREFDISKSNAYNILNTLYSNRWIEKNQNNNKYKLGLRLFELGNKVRASFKLRETAIPFMRQLVEETEETIHLTVIDNGKILYIESAQPEHKFSMGSVIGRRVHMHCTSVGKAILAYQSEDKIDKIINEKGLPKFTPNTITDKKELKVNLEKIRERGYAIDNIEHEYGIKCVGAPICNENGNVFASLSVSGPSPRFPEQKIKEYAVKLISLTNEISKKMGCNPSDLK